MIRGKSRAVIRFNATLLGFSNVNPSTGEKGDEHLVFTFDPPEGVDISEGFLEKEVFTVPARYCELDQQSNSLVNIVASYSDRIQNGRTKQTIFDAIASEVFELREEVDLDQRGEGAGPDGIFGECIDVIASTLDLIRLEYPDMSVEELERKCADYLRKKCDKWERKHG